jgi:ribosomal protein S18 acetylase RimI-like enzyme
MLLSFSIRPIEVEDRSWLAEFMREQWGAEAQVVRGELFYPHTLSGFVAEAGDTVVGVATYRFLNEETCELATLNALQSGRGIGAALIQAVVEVAQREHCRRVVVVTTNDNMEALRFYQKRGFVLSQLRPNALARSRKLKPQIPSVGKDGIPLRDEIELAMELNSGHE